MTTSHQVHIRETGETFAVAADEYILDAALRQDIWYPRYCRNGVCGSCKTTLVHGAIDMDEHRVTALNEDEYRLHRFLACRARATSDCEVAFIPRDVVPRFSHPVAKVPCQVRSIERPTDDIHIIRLRPADESHFVFTAGQYIDVSFDGLEPRGLSMAGIPGERDIELHVRCVKGGEIGDYIRNHLQPGDSAIIEGPKGRAYLREVHSGAIVAVGGGIGLAPIKSIVDMALTAGLRQDIHIYLGFRDEGEVYLEEHFRMLEAREANVRVTVVLSEPSAPTSRRTGLVSEAIAQDLGPLKGVRAYLAGPPAMIDATVSALQRIGVRRKNCFADYLFESKRSKNAVTPARRHD